EWPTKSTDPGVNFVVIVVLAVLAIAALVVGATFIIPIAIVIGIAKGIHWYVNRPTPTDQLYAQAQQRTVSANFPDYEKFLEAHIDRLLEAPLDDPPAYHIFVTMTKVTGALYKEEILNSPLPPLVGASTIEEGRYRDQLLAYQRKIVDAPRTLQVFNA